MKKTFDQTKKETAKISANAFGIRSIAILMFFVMLFTAIGSGSVLSALAVTRGDEGADDSIAESVEVSEDFASSADLYDTEETMLGRKADLASTGAKADLANVGANAEFAKTGDTTYYLWLAKDGGGNVASNYSNNGAMTANGDGTYSASFTISNTSNFAFCVCTSDSDKTSGFVTFPTASVSVSSDLNAVQYQSLNINNTNYSFLQTNFKNNSSDTTVYVTCNPTSKTMSVSTTAPSGGGSTPVASTKVYFDNSTLKWSNVYAYFYSQSYWSSGSGAGSKEDGGCLNKAGTVMTLDADTGYLSADIPTNTAYIVFLNASQESYGNFWGSGTYGAVSVTNSSTYNTLNSFDNTKPLFTPGSTTKTINSNVVYYIDGTWSELPSEETHAVTYSVATGLGSVSGDPEVGVETASTVTATASAGYEFSSWTLGDGINCSDSSTSTISITTKSSGTYTVTANFTKKNLTVTKGTHDHGDFSLSKTTNAQIGDTITISNITIDKGYTDVSFSTDPSTTISASGSDKTFTMPGEDVTVNATYTPRSGNTITGTASPSAGGTIYYGDSSSANSIASTYKTYTTGDTRYVRAVANDAYTFNKIVVTYADNTTAESTTNNYIQLNTDGSKFSDANDGSISVVAYFTKKPTHKVTVVSNNNSYGTATTSVVDAYQGQSVKLTATENSGTWSKWTVTSGTMATVNNKTTNPLTFTMGSEDLTITANFTDYEAASDYYYNGYSLSDDNASPYYNYYGKQMTKAKVGGKVYSYYEVSGRTDDNQLLTVSKYSPYYSKDGGVAQTYFQIWSSWYNESVTAQFYASDEKNLGDWSNMTFDKYNDYKNYYYKLIPDGARYVKFKNGSDDTNRFDFADSNHYNGWYSTTGGSTINDLTGFNDINLVPQGFIEYFNTMADYTADFNTIGFWDHGAKRGESHKYSKPKENSGSYYIIVLEPNTSYTFNDVTKTTGAKPMVLCSNELPDSGDTIKVYAKDGAIAGEGQTYADLADTTVLKADGTTSAGATKYTSYGNQTYEVYKAQPGETITIKTTIGLDKDGNALTSPAAASLRSKYYVRGFMVNGEVPKNTQITEPNTSTGVYTLTYTVPEDYTGKYIEITPVYFLVDTSTNPVVTFRATNFPKGQHNWGDTPYVYPFYGRLGSYNNAFGVYAGQPMFFYNGQYTMQIPQKSTAWAYDSDSKNNKGAANLTEVNNTTVSGVTMSNGYYDKVHMLIMGYGDNSASADHVQTYDYGDFYKIFNEKKPVDNIVFDFKYESTKHNFENQPGTSITKTNLESNYGTNGNGFEDLKNFHGRNVDLFGDPLSGDQLNATPVYVVSIGGVNGSAGVENIAGYYATEWMVYGSSDGTNYTRVETGSGTSKKSSIPPEVLVLNNNSTSFNDTTYPSADANHTLTNWKALYTALEEYRGKPVKISYEAADAQIGSGNYATSGSGGATRNDGRWLYSKTGESITSKIKIQYSDDNGDTYTDLNATNPQVEGLSAYFTNTEVYGKQTYATTIDPDKTFDFEAKTTNASYKFVGWYMDDDNKTQITTDNDGSTERFGSYTFIARFKLVTEGQLILSHSVDTDTIGGIKYDGAGTVTIGAVVKDGDGNTRKTYAPSTSDITIDNGTYISSESAYTIDVTLTATRGNNSALGTTLLATPSGQDAKFFDYGNFTLSDDGKTRTYTFTVKVSDLFTGTKQDYMNLIYHSYFRNYVFNYTVNYEFNDRFGNSKIYNRAGTLTAPEAEAYVYKDKMTGTSGNTTEMRMLRKEFFENLAPYESNFQQDVKWTFTDSQFTGGTNYVYNCNAHFSASYENENKKVDVTFVLPYEHLNGVATLNNGVGTAATATNYAMIKESEETDNRVTFGEIPVLTGNRTNGIYNEAEKENWIAAPLKLSDGTFFSHWSVKTTDTNTEVARCYFPGFNFLAYDNYEITAVYGSAAVDMSKTGVSTAVTYLDTTRNQWNALSLDDEAAPNVPASDKVTAGDILYNDFVLSYNYNGVEIHQGGSDTNDIAELGIVVERIKELDKNSDDTYDTRISSYTNLAPDTAKITNAAKTAGDPTTGQKTIKDTDTNKYYYKQSINKTALDNKDRIVFFEAFSNTAGWNSEKQRPVGNYSYKKYVYRAYTYITYNDGGETKTVLSETPAYFIMYDIATADYSAN